MLLWLPIITLVAFVGLAFVSDCKKWWDVHGFSTAVALVIAFMVALMGVVIVINHLGLDGYVASEEQRYESLVTQYESNYYENDNDVGKKQLMDEITKWNEDLARHKAAQRDFWLAPFYPNIYDQFEFIELKEDY